MINIFLKMYVSYACKYPLNNLQAFLQYIEDKGETLFWYFPDFKWHTEKYVYIL